MYLSESLAHLVIRHLDTPLPAVAIERAKMSLASTIASAAMGHAIESATIIRELERADGGTPIATAWFSDMKLPVCRACQCGCQ
jgi:hypothetical protein